MDRIGCLGNRAELPSGMPKNVELRLPFEPMAYSGFAEGLSSAHETLASLDECYTAYAFLCLSGVWASITRHASDALRAVHLTCYPHDVHHVHHTHGEEMSQMPYSRTRTSVVPVSHASASITPSILHSLFALVQPSEPISLAFVASDGTVTVNKIFNFPKSALLSSAQLLNATHALHRSCVYERCTCRRAPETRPSNERKEMLQQARVPGVSGTLPQSLQENGEDAATHQGGCEQPACEGEGGEDEGRERLEAHTE